MHLIDDFLIQYCKILRTKDFTVKTESVSRKRKGKREYLNDLQTRNLMKRLYRYFESKVEVPRISVGKRQTIETLINEEALVFAKFLRNERKTWAPRKLKHKHTQNTNISCARIKRHSCCA